MKLLPYIVAPRTKDQRGLGVAQILVAGLLLLLTVGVVVALYGRSYNAFTKGSGRVVAMRAAAEATRSLGPVLRSALVSDLSPAVGQRSDSVDFLSTVDWLDEGGSEQRRYRLDFFSQERQLKLVNVDSEAESILVENLNAAEFERRSLGEMTFQLSWQQPEPGFSHSETVVLPLAR